MAKGLVLHARVLSTNTVEFGFPYAGSQHATLALRSHPRFGKDVIFSIERGQIQCPSYDDCKVVVRFDDEAATNYAAADAEDNSTDMIFLRNYSQFLNKLKKAQRVRISTSIFREGAPVFDFNVSGFDERQYSVKTTAQDKPKAKLPK